MRATGSTRCPCSRRSGREAFSGCLQHLVPARSPVAGLRALFGAVVACVLYRPRCLSAVVGALFACMLPTLRCAARVRSSCCAKPSSFSSRCCAVRRSYRFTVCATWFPPIPRSALLLVSFRNPKSVSAPGIGYFICIVVSLTDWLLFRLAAGQSCFWTCARWRSSGTATFPRGELLWVLALPFALLLLLKTGARG
jgi:hypothetical protein